MWIEKDFRDCLSRLRRRHRIWKKGKSCLNREFLYSKTRIRQLSMRKNTPMGRNSGFTLRRFLMLNTLSKITKTKMPNLNSKITSFMNIIKFWKSVSKSFKASTKKLSKMKANYFNNYNNIEWIMKKRLNKLIH